MPPKRTKRRRVRKSRTAAVSSSSSSSSDEESPVGVEPVAAPAKDDVGDSSDESSAADSSSGDSSDDGVSEMDDSDISEADGGPEAPALHLAEEKAGATPRRARPAGRVAAMSEAQAGAELDEKQREAFRSLWMQGLTESFGDELDALRQNDERLQNSSSSRATGRLPLLIDALTAGSEAYTDAEEVALATAAAPEP